MRILAILLLSLGVLASAQSPTYDPTPYVHHIETKTVMGVGTCTATAIGPNAILTASHCEDASDTVYIDGDKAKIVGAPIRDGADHSIYLLQMSKPFEKFATISFNPPKVGDFACMIGNPGDLKGFYRSGQFAGSMTDDDTGKSVWMFNFFAAPGDSGAGVFDNTGSLYAVISYLEDAGSKEAGIHMHVTMAFPLKFTPDQFAQAVSFKSDPLPGDKPDKDTVIKILQMLVPQSPR
jgi:V8-like Glu-specific endopeptidase